MADKSNNNFAFIAYYRVSTVGQGVSGLGLDAQRLAVSTYLATVADSQCIAKLTEIESGKRKDRPQLVEAIKIARRTKATLVIAKLDRLARNVHFVSGFMESGVEFVACDNPHANRLHGRGRLNPSKTARLSSWVSGKVNPLIRQWRARPSKSTVLAV